MKRRVADWTDCTSSCLVEYVINLHREALDLYVAQRYCRNHRNHMMNKQSVSTSSIGQ